MTADRAMAVALNALAHIAADGTLLGRFLAESGIAPDAVRGAAAKPEFLGGVLDFVLGDERRLVDICEAAGLQPWEPAAARRELGGGFAEPFE